MESWSVLLIFSTLLVVRTRAYYYFAYGSLVPQTKRTPRIPASFTTHSTQYVHAFIMALWRGIISYYIELMWYIYPYILRFLHYNDVIISVMASQITGDSIVCSTVCSGADQRKHQSSTKEGNPSVTGGFPSQRASDADNVSIWWRHHVTGNGPK